LAGGRANLQGCPRWVRTIETGLHTPGGPFEEVDV
jgi:hypothetical protein